MLPRLFPRESNFQRLFKDIVREIVEMSALFKEFSVDVRHAGEYTKRAADIERRADTHTHALIALLNTSFITPFDREDIHYLAHELDEVIDILEDVIKNVYLYQLTGPLPVAAKFGDLIAEAAEVIYALVTKFLDPPRPTPEVLALKERLYSLEHTADKIFAEAIRSLFRDVKDPIELIKKKDLIEGLEEVMDTFLRAGNTIESVILKSR